MFARTVAACAILVASACALPAPPVTAPTPQPASAWAAACKDWDEWAKPAPPVRLYGNVYQVGTCGISAILVTGPKGHVLIDGATAEAAPGIAANIEALGFALRDVRLILHSHEHVDHVGGLAELQRRTGARVAASPRAAPVLASGRMADDDPQSGTLDDYAPVRVDRLLADGEVVRVGPLALRAILTPGHSPGAMSWQWRSCDGADCRSIVYADSLSPVAPDSYRFSDRPQAVAAFRASLDRIAAADCDILFTPHPSGSRMRDRLAGTEPIIDPSACADYARAARAKLDARLAKEGRQ